ncbi:MAG: hypothetical protein ACKOYM_04385 [Actinomycetes bacterium]
MSNTVDLGAGGDWRIVGAEWRTDGSVYIASSDVGDSFDLGEAVVFPDGHALLLWLIADRFGKATDPLAAVGEYAAERELGVLTPGAADTSSEAGLRLGLDGSGHVVAAADSSGVAVTLEDVPEWCFALLVDRCGGDGNSWTRVQQLVEEAGLEVTTGWTGWPGSSEEEVTDEDLDRVARALAGFGVVAVDASSAGPEDSPDDDPFARQRRERSRDLWTKLPLSLSKALARDRGLRTSKAADDLLAAAGDPPSTEFIAVVWPVLIDNWLPRRPEYRERLAAALRDAGVGPKGAAIDTRQQQLDFLHACRIDDVAREVVVAQLSAFADDHVTSTFAPRPPSDDDDDVPPVGELVADRTLLMRYDRRDGVTSILFVGIDDKGSFVVEGQDLGESLKGVFGRDEYEYTETYKAKVIPKILVALGEDPAGDLLEILAARWCGDQSYEFRQRLLDANLPHERWSY